MDDQTKKLVSEARAAISYSHADYSHFRVGAALSTKNHKIIRGANIESSSFGLTICAERVALVKALTEGEEDFDAIAIYAEKADFCPPCGACRQLLYDYAPELKVILTNGREAKTYKLKELLPHAFENSQLK